MAIVGALAPAVSGVFGMIQGNYQAQVAKNNAKVARWNADLASTKSEIEAQENDFGTRIVLGEQINAQAASGVTVSGRSQILTRKAAEHVGRADRMKLIQGGSVERYGHLVDEANFKAEAKAAKISGISSLVGGIMTAAGNVAALGSGAASSSLASTATGNASPYKFIPKPIPKPTTLNPLMKPYLSQTLKYGGPR